MGLEKDGKSIKKNKKNEVAFSHLACPGKVLHAPPQRSIYLPKAV